jgi:hypothetical protein
LITYVSTANQNANVLKKALPRTSSTTWSLLGLPDLILGTPTSSRVGV